MHNYKYNTFLILRNLIFSFQQADWRKAYSESGYFGLLYELVCAVLGLTTWPFFVDSRQRWGRREIKAILDTRGIKMGGWGYHNGQFMFRVKKVHARWSEYLMLQQGVPVLGKLLTGGYQPAENELDELDEDLLDSEPEVYQPAIEPRIENQPSFFSDPVEGVNRLADRLLDF